MLVAVIALLLAGSPATDLRITVWPQGRSGSAKVWTLRCAPAGGTLPSAGRACRRLSALTGNPFAPTPPGTMCTQIYGGPEEALVIGSFRGRKVWARFSRVDGCAVDRWNRLSFLFAK
jgi:hypothetical protein